MSIETPKTSEKCFVKCDCGIRSFKVRGEKNAYWCPKCEIKIISVAKPSYVSYYDKKPKKPGRKPGRKPKANGISKDIPSGKDISRALIKHIVAKSCNSCLHKKVCFLVKSNPKVNLLVVCCSEYLIILS